MRIRKRPLRAASVLVALLFASAGLATLAHPSTPLAYAAGVYPNWVGVLIGLLEIGGGLLLLVPGAAWCGVGALDVVLAGALCTQLWRGEGPWALAPAVLLGVVVAGGYAQCRRSAALRRLRVAVDAFAEHEIARQRRWHSTP